MHCKKIQDKINLSGSLLGMKCDAVCCGKKAQGLSHKLEETMHCSSEVVYAVSEI